ncbi:4Fe-4S dicluster domain-containing protein [Actinomadura sp. HBU206391]|uniref:4Fe-4S dicluster domain-containing protein n=1 Tax=Actinomadura sp. HBU206391 TaxID=2731692 RepID=UPI00164F5C1A|nr:4Fe-4S dicluster domain-containing protein [Actinomadura sp. HBU206391]MBC6462217.1 4Fe-4S dicluster domain-containing protein [Actinomadura sp. HBU206391]
MSPNSTSTRSSRAPMRSWPSTRECSSRRSALVCPTCFCATVEDVTDLTGEHAERWQRWDSCYQLEFSHLPGGSARYREPQAAARLGNGSDHVQAGVCRTVSRRCACPSFRNTLHDRPPMTGRRSWGLWTQGPAGQTSQ